MSESGAAFSFEHSGPLTLANQGLLKKWKNRWGVIKSSKSYGYALTYYDAANDIFPAGIIQVRFLD